MSNLPASLQTTASRYKSLGDSEKLCFLTETYTNREMSYPEIAELVNTYPNKIRRDAKKVGIKSRTISEAQTVALKNERTTHPTEGKEHSDETKMKISEQMAKTWSIMDDEEREYRSEIGREYWDSLSQAEKDKLRSDAGAAIRKAAKEGSKLEKFLYDTLTNDRFIVEFHREQFITNQRLQVDLFLPELHTAIEVDGPSHFRPIWGQEVLDRNRHADNQKSGLILSQGWCLIRLRQTQSLSQIYLREVYAELKECLGNIKRKFPARGNRLIVIGGE